MGCTSCTSKGGCESRKGVERQLLSHVLPLLYPGRKWGEPVAVASERADLGAGGNELARDHAAELT